jgi:hypothetical protein
MDLDPEYAKDGLMPGASGTARLTVWAGEQLPTLFPGLEFELREGDHVVGSGTIAG